MSEVEYAKIQLMKKVISITENVLEKASKNNGCNNIYYDELLDIFDTMLSDIEGIDGEI